MTFNPRAHMMNLKGKDYLPVAFRLVWFKDEHPNGSVTTEIIAFDPIPVIRANVYAEGGVLLATGHGTATTRQGAIWSGREIEKAETAAIGRALAHAGYGTQFTGEDERDNIADSPVERKQQSSTNRNQPAKVAGSINPPQDLGELDWTAREGEDGVSALVTDTVEVRMARTGKPFLTFSDGKQSAHSFTRDPLRPYMTEEQLAPLAEVGKYPLGDSFKVVFITKAGSDGKQRNEVVRIEKLAQQQAAS